MEYVYPYLSGFIYCRWGNRRFTRWLWGNSEEYGDNGRTSNHDKHNYMQAPIKYISFGMCCVYSIYKLNWSSPQRITKPISQSRERMYMYEHKKIFIRIYDNMHSRGAVDYLGARWIRLIVPNFRPTDAGGRKRHETTHNHMENPLSLICSVLQCAFFCICIYKYFVHTTTAQLSWHT